MGRREVWLQAENESLARQIMDADPAVVAGVMVYELFELTAYFDAFTGRGVDENVAQLAFARQRALSALQ